MIVSAPAKTNLWLRVLGKRDDGFHAIETRMVALSLCDQLALNWTAKGGVSFTCSDSTLTTGEDNLVIRAVRAMEEYSDRKFDIAIHLDKQIPVGAGLGGGSSDAAAIIKTINQMAELNLSTEVMVDIAAQLGSDIPFFIFDQPCDVSGRGEVVQPIEATHDRLPIVLIKPTFGISAAWAYQNLASSNTASLTASVPQTCAWGRMENDLERPVFFKYPLLAQMKDWLLEQPEIHASILSGSGSTMLGVLRHFDGGEPLVERAKEQFGETTWVYCGQTV